MRTGSLESHKLFFLDQMRPGARLARCGLHGQWRGDDFVRLCRQDPLPCSWLQDCRKQATRVPVSLTSRGRPRPGRAPHFQRNGPAERTLTPQSLMEVSGNSCGKIPTRSLLRAAVCGFRAADITIPGGIPRWGTESAGNSKTLLHFVFILTRRPHPRSRGPSPCAHAFSRYELSITSRIGL